MGRRKLRTGSFPQRSRFSTFFSHRHDDSHFAVRNCWTGRPSFAFRPSFSSRSRARVSLHESGNAGRSRCEQQQQQSGRRRRGNRRYHRESSRRQHAYEGRAAAAHSVNRGATQFFTGVDAVLCLGGRRRPIGSDRQRARSAHEPSTCPSCHPAHNKTAAIEPCARRR